ncbi:MAG: type ISP restriction/modification enzyme, partial [Patescibacteria group bacterium]
NDDYVKFIRFAESMIEKTGEGIVAMITAHGYIDNPTFRGMRYHLMQTFDQIYILDLHGNANKKEKTPDGGKDENVFNIKQGVAIFIGIRRKGKAPILSKVFHADCFGKRAEKFVCLNDGSFEATEWNEVIPSAPNYEWVVRDTKTQSAYQRGFSIAELFPTSSVGIVTSRDGFVIDFKKDVLKKRMTDFLSMENPKEALTKFELKENLKWKASRVLKHNFDEQNIKPVSYRPFDNRFIYYHDDFIERSRKDVMQNFLKGNNIGLVTARSNKNPETDHFFVSKHITEAKLGESSTQSAVFPIYLYTGDGSKTSNLKKEIVSEIEKIVGKTTPEDIFDYIYAVLYSLSYRRKYKEFLKIDFPRVPYPKDKKQFEALVALGSELRGLHLLESPKVNQFITTYPVSGTDTVEKVSYKDGKVFINADQYFGNVPEIAWNFYVGGYQPAQKWLKDRNGRMLTNSDIEHYQKMIVALT